MIPSETNQLIAWNGDFNGLNFLMIVKDRFLIGRDRANTSMFIHFYIRIDLRSANTFVINQVVSFHLCPIFSNLFSFFSFSFFSSSFFSFDLLAVVSG